MGTFAGRCAARADFSYREAEGLRRLQDDNAQGDPDQHQSRRLHIHTHTEFDPVRVECENSFLSWAKVRLVNSTPCTPDIRCAYRFGVTIPSLSADIHAATAIQVELGRDINASR